MNKPQKLMILLWVMATVAVLGLMLAVTDAEGRWAYLGAYAFVSLFFWGMAWVFADKKEGP